MAKAKKNDTKGARRRSEISAPNESVDGRHGDRLSKNDKLTLTVSILALVVSLLTAAVGIIKDSIQRGEEARKDLILSYRLGHELSSTMTCIFIWDLTKSAVPDGFADTRIASLQGLVDQLDLRLSLSRFQSFKELNAIGDSIYQRLHDTRGTRCATAHQLGLYVGTSTAFVAMSTPAAGDVLFNTSEFRSNLAKMNSCLSELGIGVRCDLRPPYRKDEMWPAMVAIDNAVLVHWDAD